MGELWRSRILDDTSWEEWEAAGEPDAVARAEAEARRLLAEHEPEPLAEDLARELARIVAAYEAQALGD
jgi:trimethylamine:corrinoid methyltransferase-like protein